MSRGCFRQMVNASHLAAVAVAVPGSATRLRPIIKPSDDSSRPMPDRTLVAIAAPTASVRPVRRRNHCRFDRIEINFRIARLLEYRNYYPSSLPGAFTPENERHRTSPPSV